MYRMIKRVFDISLALVLFPFVAMVALAFGFAFWAGNGERPVFRQKRTGLGGKVFLIWKLRTMTEKCDAHGRLLPDADRITPLGGFMRKSSIDELPQIINILKGEMSFVGPRPQVDEFLGAMTDEEKRRHDALPGITGWAQINGRNSLGWSERFAQDVWYVKNASLRLDLWILFQTPLAIIGAKGITHEGHATMPSLIEERGQLRES